MQTVIRPFLWVFVIISGYFLLNTSDDISLFWRKRIKTLIIPLVVYKIILLVLYNVTVKQTLATGLNKDFIIEIWTGKQSGHLWFVYSLLGLYIITPYLRKMLIGLKTSQIVMLLSVIFFFTSVNPMLAYFGIDTTIEMPLKSVMLFYYIMGYLLSKISLSTRSFCILTIMEIINILSMVIVFRNIIWMQSTLYEASISMIISVIFFFEIFKRIRIHGCIKKCILFLSGRTYSIYIVHLFVLQQVASRMPIQYTQRNCLYMVPIRVMCTFVVSLAICSIVYLVKIFIIKIKSGCLCAES